jgi:hypothetical protein
MRMRAPHAVEPAATNVRDRKAAEERGKRE